MGHLPKTGEVLARGLRALIVDGRLANGDHLPTETDLMSQLDVSRPVMREALRILEDERLIEVRRGSRLGPRVRIPGPEIVARPAGLLLQISGATLTDVHTSRSGFEPLAANLLASHADIQACDELDSMVAERFGTAWQAGTLDAAAALFHRRLVELSGNAVLAILAGVVHEITRTHAQPLSGRRRVGRAEFDELTGSCRRLVALARAANGAAAETHWRRHLEWMQTWWSAESDGINVRDVLE